MQCVEELQQEFNGQQMSPFGCYWSWPAKNGHDLLMGGRPPPTNDPYPNRLSLGSNTPTIHRKKELCPEWYSPPLNGSRVLLWHFVVLVQVRGAAVGIVDLVYLVGCHQIVHVLLRLVLVRVPRLTVAVCHHCGGGCRDGVLEISVEIQVNGFGFIMTFICPCPRPGINESSAYLVCK